MTHLSAQTPNTPVSRPADPPKLDRYGGFADIQREATGFFRIERINGRDCFITPDGHPYIAIGANHVSKFVQDDSQNQAILNRFGGDAQAALAFLQSAMVDMAFTAGEAYAPIDPYFTERMPYVINVQLPVRGKYEFDIFDPAVRETFARSIAEQVAPTRQDPYVLGIAFLDLPIWAKRRADYHANLPAGSPGRRAYEAFFQDHPDATADDFLGHLADTLYGFLRSAVHQAAPNHLFFGERFQLRSDLSDPVLKSVGKHVDVFCSQALIRSPQRPPEWQLFQGDAWDHEHAMTGRPILMIDWAAPFSSGPAFEHEGAMIKEELQATRETSEFLIESFRKPYMVGNFKCQLIGSHHNDRRFPSGIHRGYLQDDGTPFPFRTEATREAHITALNEVYQSLQ